MRHTLVDDCRCLECEQSRFAHHAMLFAVAVVLAGAIGAWWWLR